ncbi:MAG: beta-N-acetylhexosaminidase, partial [Cyclobacteriaceae bacterium]|nr:beta-N-acetylhexosaminidase [Cyclobacteriaceae bacterium]
VFFSASANDPALGDEGYELSVTSQLVKLNANSATGVFRGLQTLRQLLPAKVEMTTVQQGPWEIPVVSVRDYPNYSYRGVMLDVSRHFFSVEDVKRYIDLVALYKINMLHLHLSDDQGWRIEIKSWPKLTEYGGSTEVGGSAGGFYTQEQYKDIVKYAQDRFITVVPEIDMPGHTNAALASYPELNCNGKSPALYTGIEVGFSTLCTSKEITYKFIDDVVRELAEITPGPYLHIGGDESHATKKEDYIPFMERVQDIVLSHNKKIIGWDELSISKLRPETIVQVWADAENGKKAIAQGGKILMSPARKIYMDMSYDSTQRLGLHWAAYIEVDSAYIWDPATLIPGIGRDNIIGIEAALWSETITNIDEIEYMLYPRLPGYAEIGWSPEKGRDWNEYKIRLGQQAPRFKAMNVDYFRSTKVPWKD